ncbi:signal peptidase II [Ottowia thiooxydans]|uniref:signal peptidase II n=1 Tax=Ottowia thiooxydans TaxID=219182 RepID=UPI00048DD4CC|nr:signal peptidase II [Ottowia thiooxydans]
MSSSIRHGIAGSVCRTLPLRVMAYGIALAIVLLDQGIKYWVHDFTPYGWRQPITPFFNLVHVWNYGAAFSFLADAGGWQRVFFGAIALIVSVWIIFALRKPLPWREWLGYVLVLGGAVGNGLDRAMRGYVVDFLDFYAGSWHWPAFNIADIGIVCGAGLLVWSAFQRPGGSND